MWGVVSLLGLLAGPLAGSLVAQTIATRTLPGAVTTARQPLFSLPVAPLGFAAPGALYLGQRNSLVSLDFLGEDRLLFTFRVPGLHLRSTASEDGNPPDEGFQRQIRALVLQLPSGTIATEASWAVHDRARYLWPLANGHFLVRDGNTLSEGDASLELRPALRFAGPLLWVQPDPEEKLLVASSREPETAPAAEFAPNSADASGAAAPADILIRILHRDTGRVMLVSRVHSLLHLGFNSIGYVEAMRTRGIGWSLILNRYAGGSQSLGQVDSVCTPQADFLTDSTALVTTCGFSGERLLQVLTTDGRTLWRDQDPVTSVWPTVVRSANGARLAETTLQARHAISAMAPMGADDVHAQVVRVLDAATGELLFATTTDPVYDAGGNVALSPSGKRLAVLRHGAIEVYDLGK